MAEDTEPQKAPLGFAFIIEQVRNVEGKERLGIRTIQSGIPSEVIITFMKNWLKNEERTYHDFFKDKYLGLK